MPRVFFINRFYWPDEPATAQLLTDLAEALAARGHDIHIVTSGPAHVAVPATETRNGVTIHRVSSQRGSKPFAFLSFALRALWFLFHVPKSGDTLVLLTDPPLLNIPVALISLVRGLRTLHWVQDIYPEIALALTDHRWLALTRPLRNAALRRAHAIVTLGSDMAAHLILQNIPPARVHVSPNWCPANLAPTSPEAIATLRAEWGLSEKMIVAYSGNLGRVHALAPVIDLAAQLQLEHDIAFVFIGHGAQKHALQTRARELALDNVHFLPPQPRTSLATSLAAADVHLVTLHEDCSACVFPSKLYGITAAARPVLFIGPARCEVAQLVSEHEMGAAHAPDEIAALADTLRAWRDQPTQRSTYALNAARFSETSPSLEASADLWARLLS